MAKVKVKIRDVNSSEVLLRKDQSNTELPQAALDYLEVDSDTVLFYTMFDGVVQITTKRPEFAIPVFDGNIQSFKKSEVV